jgi:serine/threonine protein kinase
MSIREQEFKAEIERLNSESLKVKEVGSASVSKLKIIPKSELKSISEKPIGQGNFKRVYEADYFGKHVAVAEIIPMANNDEFKEQFRKEVRVFNIAGKHPNIVGLEGFTKEDMWLVMEFCPSSLPKVVTSLTFPEKFARIMEICRGLVFLHKVGIVHGDLKPDNVLISKEGVVRLSDFGLSANVYSSKSKVTGGTLRYMAPETSGEDDARSKIDQRFGDLFALGGCMVFILSGKDPWATKSQQYIVRNQALGTKFLPIEEIDLIKQEYKAEQEDIQKIIGIIERCFEPTPESRGSARQILLELEEIFEKMMKRNPKPEIVQSQEHQKDLIQELLHLIVMKLDVQELKLGNILESQSLSPL